MRFWNNFGKKELIIAHRGARSRRAENTMSAFEASLGRCDFIELDVGFTRDGVAIVIHDDTLERTTDIEQHSQYEAPYRVVDYSYEELQKLDFSSWFAKSDPFDTIKDGTLSLSELASIPVQRVLTLVKILHFCKEHQLPVNIELKDMRDTPLDSIIVTEVLSIIQELDIESLVLISSFNHSYLKEFYSHAPEISLAALQKHNHPDNLIEYLNAIPVKSYHPRLNIINKSIITELNSAGFLINVFTVNDDGEKRKLFDDGVNAVFTDCLDG